MYCLCVPVSLSESVILCVNSHGDLILMFTLLEKPVHPPQGSHSNSDNPAGSFNGKHAWSVLYVCVSL